MAATFTAVVSNSVLNGPEIAITDESGYVLLWLDVPGTSFAMDVLTDRLRANDFEIEGEWIVQFNAKHMTLIAKVRSDRDDI